MEPSDRSIEFGRPAAFWAGVVAVIIGVTLHLPMYVEARDMGFRLAGMSLGMGMITGMVLIIAGISPQNVAASPAMINTIPVIMPMPSDMPARRNPMSRASTYIGRWRVTPMITATTPAQKAAGLPNSMLRSDGSIGYKVSGGRQVRKRQFVGSSRQRYSL